jgi:hypothetical protein
MSACRCHCQTARSRVRRRSGKAAAGFHVDFRHPRFFDFCNNIGQERPFLDSCERVRSIGCVLGHAEKLPRSPSSSYGPVATLPGSSPRSCAGQENRTTRVLPNPDNSCAYDRSLHESLPETAARDISQKQIRHRELRHRWCDRLTANGCAAHRQDLRELLRA